MCGIAGYIGFKKIAVDVIESTLRLMSNRGPDSQGYEHFYFADKNVYLLHSRLSIIDLRSIASQPFTIGDTTLIFNGEIYNYVELKENLKADNINWLTDSDTEILLRYYLKYGEKCVDHFEGMWSFAIYNNKTKGIFLSRDRFAEKPLYYYKTESGFYFSSEIKFIKEMCGEKFSVNTDHLKRYLVNGYKSLYKREDTFFENILSLPFASNMKVNHDLTTEIYTYWKPSLNIINMSMEDAIAGFKERLLNSMKWRMRSDVPVAFCLSGGVDSAALASIALKHFGVDIATYSIVDSDERYDESKNINATVSDLNCKNTSIEISHDNFIEKLTSLVDYHDAPVATISYYIHSMLSNKISEDGYKVIFSGTAADELVTGYYDHFILHLNEMKNHSKYNDYLSGWQEKIAKYIRNPLLKDADLYNKNPDFRDHVYFNNKTFEGLLKKPFSEPFTEVNYCDSLLRNRMLNELFHEATPLILHEDDMNSMYYSIENRSPYLDTKLMEFSYSIPSEYLIQKGVSKYVLRESMKGILNDQVRCDTRKMGFNAPIASLFDLKNSDNIDYLLADSPLYDILDKNKIENMILGVDDIPNSLSKYLFSLINVKIFLENFN